MIQSKKITQADLGRKCQVTRASISFWVNGINYPGGLSLLRLAQALADSADDLPHIMATMESLLAGQGQIIVAALPARIVRQKRAYDLRQAARCAWAIVADRTGYAGPASARRGAMRYARAYNLPMPGEALTAAEIAYTDHVAGLSWPEIENAIFCDDQKHKGLARRYAKRYAQKNNLPWPIMTPKEERKQAV